MLEYTECVLRCWDPRDTFYVAVGEFARTDDEFWLQLIAGQHYLNRVRGGAIDKNAKCIRQCIELGAVGVEGVQSVLILDKGGRR